MIGIDNDFGFCDKLMNSKQARQLQLQAMGAAAMSSAMTGMMPMQPGIAGGMMIPAQQQLNMMGGSSPVQPVMTSVVPPGGAPAANAITDRLSDLHHWSVLVAMTMLHFALTIHPRPRRAGVAPEPGTNFRIFCEAQGLGRSMPAHNAVCYTRCLL